MLTVGSCFSGIGGIELGLERTGGFETKWQIENDPYAQAILKKHWRDVPRFGDIKTIDPAFLKPVDLICGGYPCQPFSLAGARGGESDPRHLWPDMFRIVRALRPRYVLLENVPGHLSMGFGQVLGDLATSGYDAEWGVLSAAGVGAPHLRRRLFALAYSVRGHGSAEHGKQQSEWAKVADSSGERNVANATRSEVRSGPRENGARKQKGSNRSGNGGADVANTAGSGFQNGGGLAPESRAEESERFGWWGAEPNVGRVVDGISSYMDTLDGISIDPTPQIPNKKSAGRAHRLRGLGNAVVPQVAQKVGEMILRFEHERNGVIS